MSKKSPEVEASIISPEYLERLADYDEAHVASIDTVHSVELDYPGAENLSYIRINEGGSSTPAFYIPGFTEGIVAKLPTVLELASTEKLDTPDYPGLDTTYPGLDAVLPEQQRLGIAAYPEGEELEGISEATYTQALGYLAIIEQEAVAGEPVQIITHSYGSLIFNAMLKIAQAKGSNIFDRADVVMLAPAGLYEEESVPRLMKRFAKSFIGEITSKKDFPDKKNEMGKAGMSNAFKNPKRTWKEVKALARERIDHRELLASGIGSLAVMTYGKDDTYSYKQHEQYMNEAVEDGVIWMTPIHVKDEHVAQAADEEARVQKLLGLYEQKYGEYSEEVERDIRNSVMTRELSVEGATHNDEQFNPKRVARAVKQHFAHLAINRARNVAHQKRKRAAAAASPATPAS